MAVEAIVLMVEVLAKAGRLFRPDPSMVSVGCDGVGMSDGAEMSNEWVWRARPVFVLFSTQYRTSGHAVRVGRGLLSLRLHYIR